MLLTTSNYPLPQPAAVVTHVLDLDPPTVSVDRNPGGAVRSGPQKLTGSSDDGLGTGVATVEVSTDGSSWQTATGTLEWSTQVDIPARRAPAAPWLRRDL